MTLNPYLTFKGQCKEAFELYAQVLSGEIVMMMPHRGTPAAEHVGEEGLDWILHARLEFNGQTLMGSDGPPEYYREPQGFYVSIQVDTPEQAERIFAALSEGGSIFMPLQETFWAVRFAMFTDRFGTPWMINCENAG